jgi:hypothetical protein
MGLSQRLSVAVAIAAAALTPMLEEAGAQQTPSAAEIINKVEATSASAPKVLGGDASLALRIKKPLTAAPDCEYAGTVQPSSTGYAVKVLRQTTGFGLICALASTEGVGKLLEVSGPVASVLHRFEFSVQGQRGQLYLLDGKSKDPNNNPSAVSGWIDYARGLWDEGTLTYSWGEVNTKQKYARIQSAWVLTYQYLYSKRFDASLEVVYRNLRFAQ